MKMILETIEINIEIKLIIMFINQQASMIKVDNIEIHPLLSVNALLKLWNHLKVQIHFRRINFSLMKKPVVF